MTHYFVLTNDPDHGLVDHYRNVLSELGKRDIFVTTAVFCTLKDDGSALSRHCFEDETHCLANAAYRDLMLELADLGHDIALHGYSQVSDTREEFQKGIDIFYRTFKRYPTIYIEHGGHPRTHPLDLCKKESLNVQGAIPDSPYFVKDIVRDVFDLVWTHDYLLDGVSRPLSVADVFHWDDGIRYFKRWRMLDVAKLVNHLSPHPHAIVGYTHFGYRGYEPRSWIRALFAKDDAPLERWSGRYLAKTASILDRTLREHGLESVTLTALLTARDEHHDKET